MSEAFNFGWSILKEKVIDDGPMKPMKAPIGAHTQRGKDTIGRLNTALGRDMPSDRDVTWRQDRPKIQDKPEDVPVMRNQGWPMYQDQQPSMMQLRRIREDRRGPQTFNDKTLAEGVQE
jgi:hypothetical protein